MPTCPDIVWVSIITLQPNQKKALLAVESCRVPSRLVSQLLPMGKEDTVPSLCREQSWGKAGMSKVSKAGKEGDFPLPALSVRVQAGSTSLSKESSVNTPK